MEALLQLSGVRIERGGRVLLSDMHAVLHAGQITVVLGPNGAGKSSLLLAMAALIPCHGDMTVCDIPLFACDRQTLSRRIAWQGEQPPAEFGVTVFQRLQLVCEDQTRIRMQAKMMDVDVLLNRSLGHLSSGERQRVELVALSLREAPVWLLDEPMSHLDLKYQLYCVEMLKAQAATGRAIVTVVHDLQQAHALADQLVLLDGRGGVRCGSADALFNREILSQLYDTPLRQQGHILMPDYGGVDEIKA